MPSCTPHGIKCPEDRDVHVGDMVVANAAIPAVADVVLRQQVLFVQAPLGPVRGHALAAAPVFRQRKLVVRVDDLHDRLVEPLFRDVMQVQPGHLLAAQALDGGAIRLGPRLQP